jgi:CheY-like chemotaxis protein
VDLHDAIRETLSFLHCIVNESVTIVFEPCTTSPRVAVDPHELQQILLNLAVHAEAAMPNGGRFTVRTALEPTADGSAGVAMTVSSSGVGIPDAGTSFHLVFPCVDASLDARPVVGSDAVRAPLRLALVEDNAVIREHLSEGLLEEGHDVVVFDSSPHAYDRLSAPDAELDVLITDVEMPTMSGIELARKLRASRGTLPVVFVTGHEREELGNDPDTTIVPKPFGVDQVLAAVERVVRRR